MRRIAFAASLFAVVLAVGGCGGATDDTAVADTAAAQPTSAGNGSTAAADCSGAWPRALPDFHGKPLGKTVVGEGLCFTIAAVTTADGRDVKNDPTAATTPWTISAQQPEAGTSVAADTPVTLTVEAAR
ncbi:hypothetical protein [Nocardia vermiculata]|uniref:PASTA domain-containing protein n=1 Tax=Nocardia vermiculata TaxID=257274 RepID=A0A846XZ72_9NOCA|nr:hypothetical protein [Nocardia vermiculata]NKY50681.1 hypothetical protein [Nocardia vermiculata]